MCLNLLSAGTFGFFHKVGLQLLESTGLCQQHGTQVEARWQVTTPLCDPEPFFTCDAAFVLNADNIFTNLSVDLKKLNNVMLAQILCRFLRLWGVGLPGLLSGDGCFLILA